MLPAMAETERIHDGAIEVARAGQPIAAAGALKVALDYAIGIPLALLALPVLASIAVAIRLSSPGPIFFRQERLTLGGRRFTMLKFRTLPHGDEHEVHGGEIRTGRVGMFLRRTSLDELPQLWHVLRGDMSVVGPRPERPVFASVLEREIPGFAQRTRVKAGITGWAQIHGLRGGTTDLAQRAAHDLWYVEHWSVGLDLRILALTLTRFWNRAARRSHASELESRVLR
jgi:putative colanic acid biosynthesis UDP-glucose lipid carrier transferase